MNLTLDHERLARPEMPLGKLVAGMALFMITAAASVLYVWGNIDDLLAGKFMLVPTLLAVVLIGAFFGLLALWGRFLKSHTRAGG